MAKCLAALTNPGAGYPGYINVTQNDEGLIVITVRGDPEIRKDSSYICGHPEKDKGAPGRCTPGDERCNNYCNLAPGKGPMANSPMTTDQCYQGELAQLTITREQLESLLGDLLP